MTLATAAPPTHVVVDVSPSTSDWIVAGTGMAALFAAIVTVFVTWRQLVLLMRSNERSQAAKFGMWAEYSPLNHEVDVFYNNGNGVPVYEVCAIATVDHTNLAPTKVGDYGPTTERRRAEPISRKVNDEIQARTTQSAVPNAETLGQSTRIAVTFRDAGGTTWERDSTGKLTKLSARAARRMGR